MPGKSRRIKGKYPPRGKGSKSRQHFSATVAQRTAVARTDEAVHRPNVSASLASKISSMTKPPANQYPYIVPELRSIGILAGVVLLTLIVLTLVLS